MTDFFKDLAGFLCPNERLGLLVVNPNIFMDRSDQIRNAVKVASSYLFPRQFTEPSFDQVQSADRTAWRWPGD
jgi:hypothetical protein